MQETLRGARMVVVGLTVSLLVACGIGENKQSVGAFCEVMDKYSEQYASHLIVLGGRGEEGVRDNADKIADFQRTWKLLVDVAPSDIEPEVQSVMDVWERQRRLVDEEKYDDAAQVALDNAGSIRRVGDYANRYCTGIENKERIAVLQAGPEAMQQNKNGKAEEVAAGEKSKSTVAAAEKQTPQPAVQEKKKVETQKNTPPPAQNDNNTPPRFGPPAEAGNSNPAPPPVGNSYAFPAEPGATAATLVDTPSQNISCELYGNSVGCSILEREYAQRGLIDCDDRLFSLEAGATGVATRCGAEYLGSSGDNVYRMSYGETVVNGDSACLLEHNGMVCWNQRTGAGFKMSSEGYTRF